MSKGFKPIFTITNSITAGLTRIERARGFLETAAVGFRGGDQQARLQDEGGGLNLRQACDKTCDKLTTRLAASAPKRRH